MNPTNNTIDVFKFFGFPYHQKVTDFLDSHTKSIKGGAYSTFRDSNTAPFKWRERLSMAEVDNIQVRNIVRIFNNLLYSSHISVSGELVWGLENKNVAGMLLSSNVFNTSFWGL